MIFINLAFTILNQVVIMFIIIFIGVLCYKIKLITVGGTKELSSIVLQIVNPAVIFSAYQRDFDKELLNGLVISLLLSALSFIVAVIVSYAFLKKSEKNEYDIERFSCIYSNCGFMGIPLVNALLGAEGVFYLTAFLTIFNLLIWTHGIIQISGVRSFKSIVSALKSPSVIAIFIGLISFLLRAVIPVDISDAFTESVFMKAVGYIADMNTPLAMLVAGATIAQVDILKAIKKSRVYIVSFLRLLVIPILILIIFSFIEVNENARLTVIIAMAAPTATMSTLFCLKYDKNYVYSSEIFAVTTILSIVTMPLVMMLNGLIN